LISLNMKYSILPSRMINERRFRLAHYNVMVCLGCHAGKSGLIYMTVETIEKECPHVKRETIKNAIKDLINWGYLYKLESKYMKGQKSKWLTNRYMLVYEEGQDIPPYEELQKEVVNLDRADDTFKQIKQEDAISVPTFSVEEYVHLCEEAVGSISGQRPNYSYAEFKQLIGDDMPTFKRIDIVKFAEVFINEYKRNPNLKEVINHVIYR
jgi:hypothetical protein